MMTKMILTDRIRNNLHFTARLAQIIPNGLQRQRVRVCLERSQERQPLGPTPRWSAGGALTPPYTVWKGSTPTGTDQIIWTQTSRNV